MQPASPGYAIPPVGSPSAGPGASASAAAYGAKPVNGGRFDFDDGGTYCGGWEDGKAHGHGVCTGPKGQGEYAGSWHFGFEVSGVYTWPSGSTFEGQWQNGKRHGLGTEYRGRWTYRGEWTQGFKGRYGVRQATASNAKYEGTWANGLQDGYGSETYADSGTYQGQWLRGLRHGYGVRTSAPFGMASHFRPKAAQGSMASLKSESAAEPTSERDRRMDDVRGGFVLKARSDEPPARRRSLVERSSNFKESILKGLKLRKQRSTGDLDKRGTSSSIRSNGSSASWMSNESAQSAVLSGSHHTDSNASFVVEDEMMDASVTETYMGEWKNDKRNGFGISERSDGLKYEGEWYNNKKYGYGVTSFKEGTKEEGKYKNNVLITSQKKKHLFLIRSAKFRERIDAAVNAAQRASKIALQKADIAISRTATARGKAEQADIGAAHAREDSDIARVIAKQFAPDFHQPGTEALKPIRGPSHQVDLNKLTLQAQQVENSQLRGYPPSGGAADSRFDEPQPSAALSSYSRPHTSIPDRLDRNSLINQPIDQVSAGPSALSSQFQSYNQPSQPQQQQQQQYNNRVGEVPSAGPYQSGALRRSHQNVMDVSAIESTKINPNARNSYLMDSSPHSQMMDGGINMAATDRHDRGRDTLRRSQAPQQNQLRSSSAAGNPGSSSYNFQQAMMNDHFDHYKRPPSRDSSVDRFGGRTRSRTRAQTPDLVVAPVISQSRPPSRQRTPFMEPPTARGASNPALDALLMDTSEVRRGATPSRNSGIEPSSAAMFTDSASALPGPSEDPMSRQRINLGQDIPPAVPYTPKRTESLFLKPAAPKPAAVAVPKMSGGGGGGGGAGGVTKRKKSLPDSVTLPKATMGIPREELAYLGSARRQELHRMQEEAERYKANPFLYLLNPNIKNWFSRQKLVVLVLFVNLSLAIMFLQLLT